MRVHLARSSEAQLRSHYFHVGHKRPTPSPLSVFVCLFHSVSRFIQTSFSLPDSCLRIRIILFLFLILISFSDVILHWHAGSDRGGALLRAVPSWQHKRWLKQTTCHILLHCELECGILGDLNKEHTQVRFNRVWMGCFFASIGCCPCN